MKSSCLPLLTYWVGAIDLPKYKVNDVSAGTIEGAPTQAIVM
jgi:hypothetical protein